MDWLNPRERTEWLDPGRYHSLGGQNSLSVSCVHTFVAVTDKNLVFHPSRGRYRPVSIIKSGKPVSSAGFGQCLENHWYRRWSISSPSLAQTSRSLALAGGLLKLASHQFAFSKTVNSSIEAPKSLASLIPAEV